MRKILYFVAVITVLTYFGVGCTKPSSPTKTPAANATPAQVLTAEANVIIEPSYVNFATGMQNLYTALVLLQTNPSVANLANTRTAFISATLTYEQCETFNFGPTNINGYDQQINTYPIDTNLVDTLVSGSPADITQNNVTNLPGNFKGFHCIEFELYGGSGNKAITQFTNRQYTYMDSLALNMLGIAQQLASAWNPSVSGNYNVQYVNAGNGSTVYTSQRAALQDLILGLYNYCDIDEIQKLLPPKNNGPAQQESPYANNSIQDVYNNLICARNCYLGQYGSNSCDGLSSLVSPNNPSLDNKIKTDMNLAMNYVNAVQPNLTQAITNNPNSVQLAINYCDTIDKDLKNKLLPYVNSIVP